MLNKMDVGVYRNSGELSDITVIVDGEEFHLHKFPLFVHSDYFKNLSSLAKPSSEVARVTLEKFPGGAKTFAAIADYCYNKEARINSDNVVSVKLATEYLQMHGSGKDSNEKCNLAALADNILFDVNYSSKARRDYHVPLKLLQQASEHAETAEKSSLHTKLIDSFAENLASFPSSTSSSYLYDNAYIARNKQPQQQQNQLLSNEETNILNGLPLEWANYLIRSGSRNGVQDALLTQIIQNYIDYNTNLNSSYGKPKEEKPLHLISMAADILKVEQKLSDLSGGEKKDDEAAKPTNLINILGDIKKKADDSDDNIVVEKPLNLINIMGDLLHKEKDAENNKTNELINMATNKFEAAGKQQEANKDALKAPRNNANANEKAKIISTLTNSLVENRVDAEFPIAWLLTYSDALDKLEGVESSVKANFTKWSWNSLRGGNTDNLDNLNSIPPAAMVKLVNEIMEKDDGKSPNSDMAKIMNLTERYMSDMSKENKLDADTFIKLAKVVPKDKRHSFDSLTMTLLDLLNKDHDKLSADKKQELIDLIDFHKVNESTLDACKVNKHMPMDKVNEAALALCARLRKELDDAKLLLRSYEASPRHYHVPHSSSSKPYTSSLSNRNYYPSTLSNKTNNYRHYSPSTTTTRSKNIPITIQKTTHFDNSPHYHHQHHMHDGGITATTTIIDCSAADDTLFNDDNDYDDECNDVVANVSTCLEDDSDLIDCYNNNSTTTSYDYKISTYTKIY